MTKPINETQEQDTTDDNAMQQWVELLKALPGLEPIAKQYFEAKTKDLGINTAAINKKLTRELILNMFIFAIAGGFAITALVIATHTGKDSYIATIISSFFSFLGGMGLGRTTK